MHRNLTKFFVISLIVVGCKVNQPNSTVFLTVNNNSVVLDSLLAIPDLQQAHVGIGVYDIEAKQYLYNYQATKNFIPASTTKLLTAYAAMRFLGDSIPAMRYELDSAQQQLILYPTGDPTLLHSDFSNHRLLPYLQHLIVQKKLNPLFKHQGSIEKYGMGWAWDDFDADYMPERSLMPIYGNTLRWFLAGGALQIQPKYWMQNHEVGTKALHEIQLPADGMFYLQRSINANSVVAVPFNRKFSAAIIPVFDAAQNNYQLLYDTIRNLAPVLVNIAIGKQTIYSVPTDTLLKLCMHRSDNFYAEQLLLLTGNEVMGSFGERIFIDYLLKSELSQLPFAPRWVDGSGLSRYNLISPAAQIALLEKMHQNIGWHRITAVLPTGNQGTLRNYYIGLSGRIYAKTGTLSNNVCLAGFLITASGKKLAFSVMVNNHMGNVTNIRRAVERFLTGVAAQ
ncbi:MAG: D-alanyl-D-alanine carboxypeptidase/D-alanyl-D-alanine-endopeptidase [Chitinophagaceae bacterium]